MNCEIKQVCDIVISARKAIFDNTKIEFTQDSYAVSVGFAFSKKNLFFRSVFVNSVGEWFDICLQRGLKNIKFLIPTNKENKHLLGFSNTSQPVIVCYWKNGKISCFAPVWECGKENEGWKIVYSEKPVKNNPLLDALHFTDKTDELKQILSDIQKFAEKIDQPYFADIFSSAYNSLCHFSSVEDDNIQNQLPYEFRSIYYAVDKADVFGAMGSWNDSPPYSAHEKGLDEEYNELSDRLLIQLRYHLMYVANEC